MQKLLNSISPSEISAGLTRAKSMISNPDLWLQNGFRKFDKRCIAQALAESAGEEDATVAFSPLFTVMSHRLLIATGKFSLDDLEETTDVLDYLRERVCNFNDAEERKHSEVMGSFDKAIIS